MRILLRVPARLRSEGFVLVPGLVVVGLFVYWGAHGGGYAPTTWEASALVILGLLVATVAGLGANRLRLSRPAAIALAALGAYVAWSYLSIAWADAPGAALDGSNRALLFLLLFALFALLPWSTWTVYAVLCSYAVGIGALAVVTLARLGSSDTPSMFVDGRLVSPLGYVNGSAAMFTTGAIVAIALAARRELPFLLRPLLLAFAAAGCQAAVLCESRGWLFALPVVLVVAVAVMPARVRFVLWSLPPLAGAALALPALVDVFTRVDESPDPSLAGDVLTDAASHAASVALPLCGAVLVAGLLLALVDRRMSVSPSVARGANRVAAGLAVAAALAGVAIGLAATHGRPDRSIGDYWDRSQGYKSAAPGSSRFALAGSNRPDFWRVALKTTADHPLGGLGQDNWSADYLRRRHTYEQPRWTHSLELRLLAHTGVVGFLLFAAFLGAALTAALRGRRRTAQLTSAAAATAILPLVVWTVHGSVDWFWEFPALSGPAFAFLGLATAAMRADGASAEPAAAPAGERRLAPTLATVAVGTAAVLAALAFGLPYLAERDIAKANESWQTDPAGAIGALGRASDLNPLSARSDLTAGVIALELGSPELAQRRLDAAHEREPENWFILFARGLAASELSDPARARADFVRARTLDPREPLVAEALKRVNGHQPLTAAEAFGSVRRDVQRLTGAPARGQRP